MQSSKLKRTSVAKKHDEKMVSVSFEVHGNVQGVYFRKHTQLQAEKLGLKGWCKNTEQGTVEGLLQGAVTTVGHMKNWLQTIGSPKSVIDRVEFKNEVDIKATTLSGFQIKR